MPYFTIPQIFDTIRTIVSKEGPSFGLNVDLDNYIDLLQKATPTPEALEFQRVFLTWRQSWTSEVSLHIWFGVETKERAGRPASKNLSLQIEINSPSTTRYTSQALAYAMLMHKVANTSALILAALDGATIVEEENKEKKA